MSFIDAFTMALIESIPIFCSAALIFFSSSSAFFIASSSASLFSATLAFATASNASNLA
jgi:hypothetical protein